MSEALRPWIRTYFEGYVSKHDDLGKIYNQRGKVQILKFLTFPKNETEFLWASLSDKECTIPARFTQEALKIYNENKFNEGRPLTGRSRGIAVINSKQILRCKPPLGPEKGLSSSWQIVLEVDEVNVIGCEGEPIFGSPYELNDSSLVRKFLKSLAEGLGNILRKSSGGLQGKKVANGVTLSRNESTTSNGSESPRGSKRQTSAQFNSTFEERYQQWQRDIESLGLLRCYDCPDVDHKVNVFNAPPFRSPLQSKSESDLSLLGGTQEAHTQAFISPNHPTTPSQWSPSAAASSSPPNGLIDTERISLSRPSQSSSGPDADSQNDMDETEFDGAQNDITPDIIDDPLLPIRHTHEAKVLVPDSDISYSQSQPLSTQKIEERPSLTTFSIPETNLDLQPQSACSNGTDRVASLSPTGQTFDLNDSFPSGSQPQRKRKRSTKELEECSKKPAKRVERNEELSQPTSPLHDPSTWRKPSFMTSSVLGGNRIPIQNDLPSQVTEADDVAKVANLKLGGWKPDWALENIPGIMTYRELKTLLSSVRAYNPG